MGGSIQCFMLDPAPKAEESLRRFVFSNDAKCVGRFGYHNTSVTIGVVDYPLLQAGEVNNGGRSTSNFDHADPRWPTKCEFCDYIFKPEDQWQHNLTRLYRRRVMDEGQLWTLSEAPVGAMWDGDWLHDIKGFQKQPDGMVLIVKTPGGDWVVDGPSSSGGHWTRSGTVPNITATPSIHFPGRYHGWLRGGILEEC